MVNDSNSSKKDLNNNKDVSNNKVSRGKIGFIFIGIIFFISILNLIFLIFIISSSDKLLNKVYVFFYKKPIVSVSDSMGSLNKHKGDHEEFRSDIKNLMVKYDELDSLLNKEFKSYKELENRVLNDNEYTWILNESDYLINLISTSLILNGNINSVIESLEMLESRLSNFKYPQIISIRKAISQDLSKILQKNYADITSSSLDIEFIVNLIDNLPSYFDKILKEKDNSKVLDNSTNMTWYGSIWDDIKNSANDLVKVRKIKGDEFQFISPDQAFFVKENIKLKLQDARLALLDRNEDIYKSDLNFVKSNINRYFDINAKSVIDINKRIDNLLSLDLGMPSINTLLGNTLNTIRDLKGIKLKNYSNVKDNKDINNDNKDNNVIESKDSLIKDDNKKVDDVGGNNIIDGKGNKNIGNNDDTKVKDDKKADDNKSLDKRSRKRRFRSKRTYNNIPSNLNE